MTNGHQSKITTEAVLNASGRTWNQWFKELETKRFQELDHSEKCARLEEEYLLDAWWAHLVAQEFERFMGLDPKAARGSFEVSVTKTFPYPKNSVLESTKAWFESEKRALFDCTDDGENLICKWLTDDSKVDVKFKSKGVGKTQLVVQHKKLPNESDTDVMRNFWKESLDSMVESL